MFAYPIMLMLRINVKDNSTIVWQKNYREDKIILEKDDYY